MALAPDAFFARNVIGLCHGLFSSKSGPGRRGSREREPYQFGKIG